LKRRLSTVHRFHQRCFGISCAEISASALSVAPLSFGTKDAILRRELEKFVQAICGTPIFSTRQPGNRLAAPTRPLPRRLSCARPIERCHLQRNEAPLSVLSSRPRSINKPLGLAEDRASGAPPRQSFARSFPSECLGSENNRARHPDSQPGAAPDELSLVVGEIASAHMLSLGLGGGEWARKP
jgi:hypothetical protein